MGIIVKVKILGSGKVKNMFWNISLIFLHSGSTGWMDTWLENLRVQRYSQLKCQQPYVKCFHRMNLKMQKNNIYLKRINFTMPVTVSVGYTRCQMKTSILQTKMKYIYFLKI